MRLISNGVTTAVSTLASRGGFGGVSTAAASVGSQGGLRIEALQVTGDSSVADTVGIKFRYGASSNSFTTIVVCPANSSVLNVRLDGLGITAAAFEWATPTTAGGVGWSVFTYGK